MVRDLLGDVIGRRAVGVIVPASEELTQDRVVRLLDALGLDVPPAEVVRQDADEALLGGLDRGCPAERGGERVSCDGLGVQPCGVEGVVAGSPVEGFRVRVKVSHSLEHRPRLEDEAAEGDRCEA